MPFETLPNRVGNLPEFHPLVVPPRPVVPFSPLLAAGMNSLANAVIMNSPLERAKRDLAMAQVNQQTQWLKQMNGGGQGMYDQWGQPKFIYGTNGQLTPNLPGSPTHNRGVIQTMTANKMGILANRLGIPQSNYQYGGGQVIGQGGQQTTQQQAPSLSDAQVAAGDPGLPQE
jgi:hypothetical protein